MLGKLKERDHLEDLGLEGSNIKMHLKEISWEGMDRIDLALDRDKWWALENMVMNF
jgi:hypothetical protein